MINVTDLRAGTTFQINGMPYIVVRYTHTKMGRGTANVRVEVKNLKTGGVEGRTFMSNAKVEAAQTIKRKTQYLYSDEQSAIFMDPTTFEQFEIPLSISQDSVKFLKDGDVVNVLFWSFGGAQDTPLSLELSPNVALSVADTGPGVRGNSATNVWKSATLENGLEIKVPLFIDNGDRVRVDTRTGEYVERVTLPKKPPESDN